MDCTAAPQVIEPLEMTTQIVLSRHITHFYFGILELCWLCWLCYTASRVNFFWIPLSVQRHGHDIWAMISEAPEGTAELHTLRYQMGATKRRRLSSRRRTVVLNLFQKGLVFGILDASEIGMDLHHYIILYHVTAHRHIRNYIYTILYRYIQIMCTTSCLDLTIQLSLGILK